MKCDTVAVNRVEGARKMLVGQGFLSEREDRKVQQRIKRWIRDSGQKPAELKEANNG